MEVAEATLGLLLLFFDLKQQLQTFLQLMRMVELARESCEWPSSLPKAGVGVRQALLAVVRLFTEHCHLALAALAVSR